MLRVGGPSQGLRKRTLTEINMYLLLRQKAVVEFISSGSAWPNRLAPYHLVELRIIFVGKKIILIRKLF